MSLNLTVSSEVSDELRKENVMLRKELEDNKQELHGFKRQIQLLEALNIDFQSEIELLQGKENSEKLMLEEKILSLEQSNINLKSRCNQQRQSLENHIVQLEEENAQLHVEIEGLKKATVSVPATDGNKSFDDINLKQENEMLQVKIEEMNIALETLGKVNLELEERVLENTNEIVELKDSLACKREELLDAKNLIQKLSEETIYLKNELETHKSQPLDKSSKGNSLFAEVDDRRVYLQTTINNMKTEYIAMKQEVSKHLNTIRHLKLENRKFLERWKADIAEKEDDNITTVKAYKNRIAVLENLIEKYKKDLEVKQPMQFKDNMEVYSFCDSMINSKQEELEEVRKQLAAQTVSGLLLTQALNQANKEKRHWRLEACVHQKDLEIHLEKERLDRIDKDKERQKINSLSLPLEDISNDHTANVQKDANSDVITIDTSEDEDLKEGMLVKRESDKINVNLPVDKQGTSAMTPGCETVPEVVKSEIKIEKSPKDDEKENEATERRVTFASDSLSPKKSNLRKCKKVIICKPVSLNVTQKPK